MTVEWEYPCEGFGVSLQRSDPSSDKANTPLCPFNGAHIQSDQLPRLTCKERLEILAPYSPVHVLGKRSGPV